jgi:Holliday junction resolvase RusA-like endonuclease
MILIDAIYDFPIMPKARPRCVRNNSVMPAKYKTNQKALADWMMTQRVPGPAYNDAVSLIVIKHCLMPKSGKSTRGKCVEAHPACTVGDIDNIAGSVMDALVKAGVLTNDHIVCSLTAKKAWSPDCEFYEIKCETIDL